jgi:hypothetical protein
MDYTADYLALKMAFQGVPLPWLEKAHALALESEGVLDLMHLWLESPTPEDRVACVATIQECLEDSRVKSPEENAVVMENARADLEGCASVVFEKTYEVDPRTGEPWTEESANTFPVDYLLGVRVR